MPSLKTPVRFLEAVLLDIIAAPGIFMSKKANAEWHLRFVCPLCSKWRKSFRCYGNKKICLWHQAWKSGNYDFPRSFGVNNWLRYYFGIKTHIKPYKK